MVVLSNIQAYSDYDFSDGHRMQSGGRKGSIRLIASIRGKKCVFISPSFLSFLSSSPLLSYGDGLMAPKRTSTSAAPAMTQAAIKKLVVNSVSIALEAQAATIANTDNTNRNTEEREAPVAKKLLPNLTTVTEFDEEVMDWKRLYAKLWTDR
ncbi:hypothetical protein Tco_0110966 [Tanacetum coccineum]